MQRHDVISPSQTPTDLTRSVLFVAVMRWLQLRFDRRPNPIRLQLQNDDNSTALRPFDDVRYERRRMLLWAATLRPK